MHILTNLLPLLQFIATEPDIWHPTQIYCYECECEFFPEIKRRKNSNDFEEATEAVTFVYVNIVTGSRFAIIKIRDLHSVFIRLFSGMLIWAWKGLLVWGKVSFVCFFVPFCLFEFSSQRPYQMFQRISHGKKKKKDASLVWSFLSYHSAIEWKKRQERATCWSVNWHLLQQLISRSLTFLEKSFLLLNLSC